MLNSVFALQGFRLWAVTGLLNKRLISGTSTARLIAVALAVASLFTAALFLLQRPAEAIKPGPIAPNKKKLPLRFVPDALTGVIRDGKRRLVRFKLKNADDLDRAYRSGTLLQNFETFALISQPAGTKLPDVSAKVIETTVSLPGKSFDPIASPRDETVYANSSPEPGYYIVQFGGLVTDEWLDDLRTAGIEILQYVPHQAFLVYGDSDAISSVANHPRVRWVGRYLADEKIPPVLSEQIAAAVDKRKPTHDIPRLQVSKDGRSSFDIAVFARADIDRVAAEISSQFGASVRQVDRLPNNFFNIIRVEMPVTLLINAAALPDVVRIDAGGIRMAEDERAAQVVAGNYSSVTSINAPGYDPLTQFGVDGTGVTVAVADDGISIPGNGGFYITASNTKDGPMHGAASGATSSHGHLNASIIAGSTPFGGLDPLGYNYGLGIAPKANILNIPLLLPSYAASNATSYDDTISSTGVNGVRATISNNSWGVVPTNMNVYDSMAAEFDGYARDSSMAASIDPLLLVFSAGNSGPSAMSLTRPKVAKNIIAVGNSENLRTEFGFSGADNIDDLNDTSSRGPAADGRIKPDVTAPGSFITGSRAGSCSGVTLCFDAVHAYSVGTSHAAPQVAGAAALFTQFWRDTNAGQTPSPALIKAAIINSAQDMNGIHTSTAIPNGDEGWGRLNMKQMFTPGFPVSYVDNTALLSSPGNSVIYNGTVLDPTKPIRVTLVWTDPPAVSDPALVNDLDLTVTVNSSTYHGNVFSGGISTTGGTANSVDNIENVFLLPGTLAGTVISVSVTAAALNGDGVLGNADLTDQNFSLVLSNFAFDTTAAGANIAGRITDQFGRGVPRTIVALSSFDGTAERTVLTNTFGFYQFSDVQTGRSYLISPRNRKYTFEPPSIFYNHFDEVSGLDFRASTL